MTNETSSAARFTQGQYLTFTLGKEEYAVEILKVQEIKGSTPITPMPNTPPHIKGVINLRGTVVPVIGLREKFGMEPAAYDKFSVILLVLVGTKTVGIIVDAVSDVLTLTEKDVEATPELDGVDTSFIRGLAKSGDKLIALLDLQGAIGLDQLSVVAAPGPISLSAAVACSMPRLIAGAVAALAEAAWQILPLKGAPPLQRTTVLLIGQEVTVVDSKARGELGYLGSKSREQGLRELKA